MKFLYKNIFYKIISFDIIQYLRQIEFNYKIDFSDLIKSICYDSNIKCFYMIFEIGEGVIIRACIIIIGSNESGTVLLITVLHDYMINIINNEISNFIIICFLPSQHRFSCSSHLIQS